ncbi:DUF4381 domain-containing protein [Endozoicomonas sp. 8E]|uniref:DUF4381 domain-containing protein n=1 Tax=Endozoicomonas sp. 8E TaxID=3035692 RepID=UPI0029390F44|nr:DUF4381 domain-containing protein [Endozoicomonas sp. 8E]WOG26022.1 DUF4381 domain-containing protein [Endozoicomonas sp. 8E]
MTPNPLDQLRPNHLPDPVSFWPLAPGWWLSAVLIIVVVTLTTLFLVRYVRRNRYRRQARKQAHIIFSAYQNHQNSLQFANDCNRLLKQTALHAYPAEQVAALHGAPWLEFLSRKSGILAFSGKPGQSLGDARFQKMSVANEMSTEKEMPTAKDKSEVDVNQLHKLTVRWIRKHHA